LIANAVNHIGGSGSQPVGHLSPKKRKLIRSLEKVVNKCIDRHCDGKHPTTDLLRERIYTALEGVLLGVEVDEIVPSCYPKGADNPKAKDDEREDVRP
jgi:hypothetical protein